MCFKIKKYINQTCFPNFSCPPCSLESFSKVINKTPFFVNGKIQNMTPLCMYEPCIFCYYACPTEEIRYVFFIFEKSFLENGLESQFIFVLF